MKNCTIFLGLGLSGRVRRINRLVYTNKIRNYSHIVFLARTECHHNVVTRCQGKCLYRNEIEKYKAKKKRNIIIDRNSNRKEGSKKKDHVWKDNLF